MLPPIGVLFPSQWTGLSFCAQPARWLGNMVQVQRQYSPTQIDRAGRVLIDAGASPDQISEAVTVIDNWRTAHSYPLELARTLLYERAVAVNPKPVVAERLKRLESIREKLSRESVMKLSRMQDIGGCRVVFRNTDEVKELVRAYEGLPDVKVTDYVANPRISGYRSTHLIWRFRSEDASTAGYNNMRIEIQIRTALQHSWATAVEIASTFTGNDLKSDHPKCGDTRWVRFFALMGTAMAMREGGAPVPDTPTNKGELVRELGRLSHDLQVQRLMKRWSKLTAIRRDKLHPNARLFLITLRPSENHWYLIVKAYMEDQAQEAAKERVRLEKESRASRGVQVALVAVESIDMLRTAYPNYYADTTEFLKALQMILYGATSSPVLLASH